MALLLMDGFDLYADETDVKKGGWDRAGTAASSTLNKTGGRYGGGCLETVASAGTSGWIKSVPRLAGNTIYICFAYRYSALPSFFDYIVRGYSSKGTGLFQLYTVNTTTGQLNVSDNPNTANIATAASAIGSINTWYWIELKVVLGTSNSNGSVEIKVNGSTVATGSGGDIFDTSTDSLSHLVFGAGITSGLVQQYDDIVVMDDSGSYCNGFIGDSRIETLIPAHNGPVVNWTPSSGSLVSCVDDALGSISTTDYISSATSGQEARFKMTKLSDAPTTIHAVQQRTHCAHVNASEVKFNSVQDLRGNRVVGTQNITPGPDYAWKRHAPTYLDPGGGRVWNYASLTPTTFGIRVV